MCGRGPGVFRKGGVGAAGVRGGVPSAGQRGGVECAEGGVNGEGRGGRG